MRHAALLATTATAALLLSGCFNSNAVTEERVKEIVAEYIKNDTQAVLDAINAHMQAEQKRQQDAALEQMLANPLQDAVAAHSPVWGNATAPITIIKYSDFECPFCARGADVVKQLQAKYGPEKIRIAYKHLPLGFHKNARPAALAAQAANNQGKFWEFAEGLFANQQNLNDATYTKLAKDLGLDLKKFDADRKSAEAAKQVDADMADATRLNIQGTPNFLVNGVLVPGAQPVEQFEAIITKLEQRQAATAPVMPVAPAAQ